MIDTDRQRPKTTAALQRCEWCTGSEIYQRYHDEQWGVPEYEADEMFERLVLESMQAGLSWLTVLKKRACMQQLFFAFNRAELARATASDVERWMADPGIIRHRGKLDAIINNASAALRTEDFAGWLWQFAPSQRTVYQHQHQVPSSTRESHAMAKALKQAGFRFVGPTICYAFMQSVGMVNDHLQSCWRHQACAEQWLERDRQPR